MKPSDYIAPLLVVAIAILIYLNWDKLKVPVVVQGKTTTVTVPVPSKPVHDTIRPVAVRIPVPVHDTIHDSTHVEALTGVCKRYSYGFDKLYPDSLRLAVHAIIDSIDSIPVHLVNFDVDYTLPPKIIVTNNRTDTASVIDWKWVGGSAVVGLLLGILVAK